MPPVTRGRKRKQAPACKKAPARKKGKEPDDADSPQCSIPPPLLCQVELDLNDVKCPICKELVRQPVSANCGHTFCETCIVDTGCSRCPLCDRYLGTSPSYMLRSLLEKVPEYRERCREVSLDSLKEKVEQLVGTIKVYRSSYSESIQCSILNKMLQCTSDQACSIFTSNCFVFFMKTCREWKEPELEAHYVQYQTAGRFLRLEAEQFLFFVWQPDGDSSHPLKLELFDGDRSD